MWGRWFQYGRSWGIPMLSRWTTFPMLFLVRCRCNQHEVFEVSTNNTWAWGRRAPIQSCFLWGLCNWFERRHKGLEGTLAQGGWTWRYCWRFERHHWCSLVCGASIEGSAVKCLDYSMWWPLPHLHGTVVSQRAHNMSIGATFRVPICTCLLGALGTSFVTITFEALCKFSFFVFPLFMECWCNLLCVFLPRWLGHPLPTLIDWNANKHYGLTVLQSWVANREGVIRHLMLHYKSLTPLWLTQHTNYNAIVKYVSVPIFSILIYHVWIIVVEVDGGVCLLDHNI